MEHIKKRIQSKKGVAAMVAIVIGLAYLLFGVEWEQEQVEPVVEKGIEILDNRYLYTDGEIIVFDPSTQTTN